MLRLKIKEKSLTQIKTGVTAGHDYTKLHAIDKHGRNQT
jgi:hypothetical protein